MKKIVEVSNLLSKKDITFIMSNLTLLGELRNEDETFNRSIYIAKRENKLFTNLFDKCDNTFFEHFGKKLKSHELYFIKYYKGDYIKKHNDNWQTSTSSGRLYSLVAQMTHPNLYKGGDTIVYGDKEVKLSKNQGDGIIFPSSTDHELTEITEGIRFSFVVMFKETLKFPLL